MLVRNLNLKDTSTESAKRMVVSLLESRKCSVTQLAADGDLEYFGLSSLSTLTVGYGFIAIVNVDGNAKIRIGLQTSLTISGSLLGLFSILASIPLIGMPLLLFMLLYDQAASRVTHELDHLVGEILGEIHRMVP